MSALTVRVDSWASALTTLGTQFDKFKSYVFLRPHLLSAEECSVLYHYNPLAKKICDIFPEDALREGVCAKDDEGQNLDDVDSRLTELDAVKAMTLAAVWGNTFGWGAVFLGVDDGLEQSDPLDPTRVTQVRFLRVVDRRDVAPRTWYTDPLSPKFDLPQTFTFVQAQSGAATGKQLTGVEIHESRFIKFEGARTSVREQRGNGGFPHSKLQAVQEQLLRVGVSWDNAAQLLQVVSQTVMKIKGLQQALVSDKGAEALEKRAQLIDMTRGITRSLWIDADGEEVSNLSTPLAGVSDILDRLGAMLAASTGIPVTKLFGTQPTGLAATGAADERSWNNRVESYRTQELLPAFDKLVSCLAAELKIAGDVNVDFPSLDRPTDAENAAIRLQVAQADQIYIATQTVLPEEIAVSRFGGPNYSIDTHLNPGPRDELEFPAPPGSEITAAATDELNSQTSGKKAAARQDGSADQPRDKSGRWSGSSGGGDAGSSKAAYTKAADHAVASTRAALSEGTHEAHLTALKAHFAAADKAGHDSVRDAHRDKAADHARAINKLESARSPKDEQTPAAGNDFAGTLHAAIDSVPSASKMWGEKTFIGSVRDNFPHMSDEQFKSKLFEAHQSGHVELTRADLTPAIRNAGHGALLDRSEHTHGNTTFHFVAKGRR